MKSCKYNLTIINYPIFTIIYYYYLNFISSFSLNNLRTHISELIKSQRQQQILIDGMAACKMPELSVNNPEILKYLHDVPPLECSPDDWVVVQGSKLIIQEKAKEKFGPIICAFRGNIQLSLTNLLTIP